MQLARALAAGLACGALVEGRDAGVTVAKSRGAAIRLKTASIANVAIGDAQPAVEVADGVAVAGADRGPQDIVDEQEIRRTRLARPGIDGADAGAVAIVIVAVI